MDRRRSLAGTGLLTAICERKSLAFVKKAALVSGAFAVQDEVRSFEPGCDSGPSQLVLKRSFLGLCVRFIQDGNNYLHLAAKFYTAEIAAFLLSESTVGINKTNDVRGIACTVPFFGWLSLLSGQEGLTPLLYAVTHKPYRWYTFAVELLKAGADEQGVALSLLRSYFIPFGAGRSQHPADSNDHTRACEVLRCLNEAKVDKCILFSDQVCESSVLPGLNAWLCSSGRISFIWPLRRTTSRFSNCCRKHALSCVRSCAYLSTRCRSLFSFDVLY
jgi:hypothetical protein